MNRIVSFAVASCLVAICSMREGMAEFVPRTFEARKTEEAPIIDGSLEPIWDSAQKIDEFFAYQSGGDPAAANTSAWILWDEQFLYVAFQMMDVDIRPSSVTANQTGRDAQLFLGDVIELFVRENRASPKYFEFEWSPNSSDVFDARFDERKFGPPGTAWNTEIDWAVSVDGTIDQTNDQDVGWIVESSIPLSAFDPISIGSEWTFTVARYDYFNPVGPAEQLMTSTPGDPELPRAGFESGFHTYELYENLKFVPEPKSSGFAALMIVMLAVQRRRHRESNDGRGGGFTPPLVGITSEARRFGYEEKAVGNHHYQASTRAGE